MSSLNRGVLKLTLAGVLVALSIVLGKILSVTAGAFRVSLENLPVILAGVWMGPLVGMVVGVAADLLGSILVGFTINPIITVGAGLIGFLAGFVFHMPSGTKLDKKLVISVMTAHVVGSMIVKSIGLALYYGYPLSVLLVRVPLYLVIGFVEFLILRTIVKRVKYF